MDTEENLKEYRWETGYEKVRIDKDFITTCDQ